MVGSHKQPINFVIDTGSGWTWTTIDKCTPNTDEEEDLLEDGDDEASIDSNGLLGGQFTGIDEGTQN